MNGDDHNLLIITVISVAVLLFCCMALTLFFIGPAFVIG
jgi:hypothetical protein